MTKTEQRRASLIKIGLNPDAEPFMVTWERGPAGRGPYDVGAPHVMERHQERIAETIERALFFGSTSVSATKGNDFCGLHRLIKHKKPLNYIYVHTGVTIK